jgi:hypothetical protein
MCIVSPIRSELLAQGYTQQACGTRGIDEEYV